ncbi:hypothetical protein [Actinoplanes awajinensis]|uniref:Gram-positive cocci surface proteins LPxTG domain-containing protein n=1 Tax=Actinoplanes awajinensis subsp. mycoplanecinus TaxID=135947 RepID=A0A0X3UTF3_9ACTN|nr:hypothetical protein [Actinoplanes awajinensis]KUL35881.1 hypothetical protein ADL15_14110 [Actinoplanes awajinensis subsp. mycoplanecinus]
MSFVRRLALGLPAAGVTAFAALAISSPALAADAAQAAHPAVMVSPDRGSAGYGAELPATTEPTATSTATVGPPVTATATTAATVSPDATGDTRGNSGYGGESPTATPSSVQPTGDVQSVPPGGVSSETAPAPSGSVTTKGSGVSDDSLPLTGGPVGATIGIGAVLVAGGAGAMWYARKRKTA